jgi:hypothetical protein
MAPARPRSLRSAAFLTPRQKEDAAEDRRPDEVR